MSGKWYNAHADSVALLSPAVLLWLLWKRQDFFVCPLPLCSLPCFSPFHPSLPWYRSFFKNISCVIPRWPPSFLFFSSTLIVSMSKHVNNSPFLPSFPVTVSFSSHHHSLLSLLHTLETRVGQYRHCFGHTEAAG